MAERNDAATTLALRDKAHELFADRSPAALSFFMQILAETYNALGDDNDYDLDIG